MDTLDFNQVDTPSPPAARPAVVTWFIICLGMTSCCALAACIPLLLFWIKPDTKQWFGA